MESSSLKSLMPTLLCFPLGSYMVTFSVSSCTGEQRTLRLPDLEFPGVSCSRIVLSCSVVIITVLSEDFLPGLGFPLFSGLNQQSCTLSSIFRLCLGCTGFVFRLILIALTLIGISIVGSFKFMALCFECLHDFKFLKIINSALKIELIKFNVRTKNDRLPFFRQLQLRPDQKGFFSLFFRLPANPYSTYLESILFAGICLLHCLSVAQVPL